MGGISIGTDNSGLEVINFCRINFFSFLMICSCDVELPAEDGELDGIEIVVLAFGITW